jgi:predicted nucleotidyltransferase
MVSLGDLQLQRDRILAIAAQHGAGDLRVFGSVARGEQTDSSDLDILVRMNQGRSLLDKVGLLQDLQDFIGCPVHVAEDQCLHPRIRDRVLKEAIAL